MPATSLRQKAGDGHRWSPHLIIWESDKVLQGREPFIVPCARVVGIRHFATGSRSGDSWDNTWLAVLTLATGVGMGEIIQKAKRQAGPPVTFHRLYIFWSAGA
jgi:hypothetical protein